MPFPYFKETIFSYLCIISLRVSMLIDSCSFFSCFIFNFSISTSSLLSSASLLLLSCSSRFTRFSFSFAIASIVFRLSFVLALFVLNLFLISFIFCSRTASSSSLRDISSRPFFLETIACLSSSLRRLSAEGLNTTEGFFTILNAVAPLRNAG